MFVCIKLTERPNSDFLEETRSEKQFGEKQFENSRTPLYGQPLNTDNSLLRTVFFIFGGSPYIVSKFNPLEISLEI